MKDHHFAHAVKVVSLAMLISLPIKYVAATEEFDTHRQQQSQEFQEFKGGKSKAKPAGNTVEAKPAEVKPAAAEPVAIPVQAVLPPPVAIPVAPPATPAMAKGRGAGSVFRDCPECPDVVVIPAGVFNMGSDDGEGNEMPVHRVTIGHAFAIGKTEVTQAQWRALMGGNPSYYWQDLNRPVERVTWRDAQSYISKLNAKTGKQYRLPTEAEWEYACRAGEYQKHCGKDDAFSVAWYKSESVDPGTHPVGGKQPNAWGLYDMGGNVAEWVEDSYQDNYEGAPTDGSAWHVDDRERRVIRGGSWSNGAGYARASARGDLLPSLANSSTGFRIVRTLP